MPTIDATAAYRENVESQNRPLVYLACPYTSPNPLERAWRFDMANRAAGLLMSAGLMVFSPISHTHPIAESCELPKDWGFWEKYDRAVLSCCYKLIVLKLPGWEASVGVQAEIKIAHEMGILVEEYQLADLRAGRVTCTRVGGSDL